MLCVLFLLLFPYDGFAVEFSTPYVIDNFFKGRELDSIEGIWEWETLVGKYEGAMIA